MSRIGDWLARKGQKAHLVESEIANRVVTRCGRELEQMSRDGTPLLAHVDVERCKQCVGRIR